MINKSTDPLIDWTRANLKEITWTRVGWEFDRLKQSEQERLMRQPKLLQGWIFQVVNEFFGVGASRN